MVRPQKVLSDCRNEVSLNPGKSYVLEGERFKVSRNKIFYTGPDGTDSAIISPLPLTCITTGIEEIVAPILVENKFMFF